MLFSTVEILVIISLHLAWGTIYIPFYAATVNIVFKDTVNYGEWFAVRRPYGQKEEGLTETWGDEGS